MVNDTKEEQITRSKLNSTTGKLEYFKQLVMREDRIIISTDEGGTLAKKNTEKHTLREKCPNTELFLVRIFLYSVRIKENTDHK